MPSPLWPCTIWRVTSARCSWGSHCRPAPTWCCWSVVATPNCCGSMDPAAICAWAAAMTMRPERLLTRWPGCWAWPIRAVRRSRSLAGRAIPAALPCPRAGCLARRGATTPTTSVSVASRRPCCARCGPWSRQCPPSPCPWPIWRPASSRWWRRCWWSGVAAAPGSRDLKPWCWLGEWQPTGGCGPCWSSAAGGMAWPGGWRRWPTAPTTQP